MKYVKRYCDKILGEEVRSCQEQKQLCQRVLRTFENEDIYIDEKKVDNYFGLEKYFRYSLFDWERFCFVLHCCTYRRDGMPRWSDMFGYMGRGSGKNGYTSFEDFALLSPKNGIRGYNIQSFAAAEANAKTSFEEVRLDVLAENETKLKKFFSWNKEEILCTKTKSKWTYHTSAPRSKDGGRPGKVNFDEIHVFENKKLMTVASGGLGKVADPRTLITSTDGFVRDGPLDEYKNRARAILNDENKDDNGMLPFMCHLTLDRIEDPDNWIEAIPSLDQFLVLREQVKKDFITYKENPFENREIIVKRFNCTEGEDEGSLTSWDNIQVCCQGVMPQDIPELAKRPCVFAIDSANINDFFSAVILSKMDGIYYAEQHSWICTKSRDLPKIKFPIDQAVARGEATLIDDVDISMELPFQWIRERTRGRRILAGASDAFLYKISRKVCESMLHMKTGKRYNTNGYGSEQGWFYFNRPSDIERVAIDVNSIFNHRSLYCGDSMIMRWYFGNVKKVLKSNGNTAFEKIEPKSRKTDGAMAFFAALTVADFLDPYDRPKSGGVVILGTRVY